jgi:hypothetical protein
VPLQIPESQLLQRWNVIRKLFAPLTPNNRPLTFFKPTPQGGIVALGTDNFGTNPRLARHVSKLPDVFLNYYEIWIAQREAKAFRLDKAYFHLDTPRPDGGNTELLAIHCDAFVRQAEPSALYKRGPHVHVAGAARNLQRAHIALCLASLDTICSDFTAYSTAFGAIVKMVDDEVFPNLR